MGDRASWQMGRRLCLRPPPLLMKLYNRDAVPVINLLFCRVYQIVVLLVGHNDPHVQNSEVVFLLGHTAETRSVKLYVSYIVTFHLHTTYFTDSSEESAQLLPKDGTNSLVQLCWCSSRTHRPSHARWNKCSWHKHQHLVRRPINWPSWTVLAHVGTCRNLEIVPGVSLLPSTEPVFHFPSCPSIHLQEDKNYFTPPTGRPHLMINFGEWRCCRSQDLSHTHILSFVYLITILRSGEKWKHPGKRTCNSLVLIHIYLYKKLNNSN